MSEVTQVLNAIHAGDLQAADQLLPLVYEELRKLAANWMLQESPNNSLQPTALVHEAYLRLVDSKHLQHWDHRGHFFAAAAEAMRRILVERARRRQTLKRGGDHRRIEMEQAEGEIADRSDELLCIHEALDELAECDSQAAQLVKLRYFGGFGHQEAAKLMGLSRGEADRLWAGARIWLFERLREQ